jgi:hypothetical protein
MSAPAGAAVALLAGAIGAGLAAPAWAQAVGTPMVAEALPAKPGKRSWSLHEFTTIRLVRREPGSKPNQHPASVSPAILSQQLAAIQFVADSAAQRLFSADEVAELTAPLAQALASAGPDDDVVLLSTSRRGEGFLTPPTGVTARLFVQDGALQVLLNDTRLDFVNRYRGTNIEPEFVYGSRAKAGPAVVQSGGARNVRADWLAVSLTTPPVEAGTPPAAAAKPVPAPPAAAPAPAPAAQPAASGDEIERRLTTLKRLRERNLISEEEYQQKRREILQQL